MDLHAAPLRVRKRQGLLAWRYLFRLLAERDLRERYAGSWLGISWSVIQPTVLFVIYDLVFSIILQVRPDPVFKDSPFALWLVAGLTPWLFVAEVLARSPGSIVDHARMVTKNAFPNELLPTVTVVSALTNHVLTLALLCAYLAFVGVLSFTSLALVLPWFVLLTVLGLGLAWIFAAVGVYFRDLSQLAGLLAMAWSFATPIFYPETNVPARFGWLLWLNPVCLVVRGYRLALLGDPRLRPGDLGMATAWCLALLGLGYLVFNRLKRGFADLL